MLDQGLISGSNFLLTILLARWLSSVQYGAYALAFSIFLLLANPYESLVSDPMMVFGSSTYADHRREYLGAVLKIAAILGLTFAAVLGLSAAVAHHLATRSGFAGALAGLSLWMPWVLLFWTSRYAFYLKQSPGSAALGALLYSILVLSGTLFVFERGLLSPFTAFVVVTLGALATALFMLVRLKPALKGEGNAALSSVWRQHWHYGRWVLGTVTVRWIPGNVLYLLTGSLLGMADVGGLRALLNLNLPILSATTSLSNVFVPYISRIYGKEGRAATRTAVNRATLLYFGGGVIYLALMTTCRGPILHLLYGGKYMEYASLVPWVTLGAVLLVASYGRIIGLRAIQSPSSVFAAYSTCGIVAIASGVAGTWLFGLPGAVASYVLSGAILLTQATYGYRKKAVTIPVTSGGQ
jgi:O-antigen/teichoic acid export membrane protein